MTEEAQRRAELDHQGSEPDEWGPPTRPAGNRRQRLATVVSVRFTPDEIAQVRSKAQAEKVSVSELIRSAVLRDCRSDDAPSGRKVFVSYRRGSELLPPAPSTVVTYSRAAGDREHGGLVFTNVPTASGF
jgi:mobilization protein NikA